jgi:phosphoribosylformylglycinamidine synthase
MFSAAHDVSDGGVIQTLVEMAIRSNIGARLWVPEDLDPFVFMWSESATRAVVVVPRSEEMRFSAMCEARNFAATRIGVVDSQIGSEYGLGGQALRLENIYGSEVSVTISELSQASEKTLPALFG